MGPRELIDNNLIGESEAMELAKVKIQKVAKFNSPILITGESGTGKDIASRLIHELSDRRDMPYVAINSAAIPSSLFEAELFGYCRGAFTGAVNDKRGKLEVANGGTLFLDEIGDMPLYLQAKLLRVLESGIIERVGDNKQIKTNFRLICATHQNIRSMVIEKRFRHDLYFRVSTLSVHLPALREIASDIPLIANALVQDISSRFKIGDVSLSPSAIKALEGRKWTGNVRELRGVLERAVVEAFSDSGGGSLTGEDIEQFAFSLPTDVGSDYYPMFREALEPMMLDITSRDKCLPMVIEALERAVIDLALERYNGNEVVTSRKLGISRNTLRDRLKRYDNFNKPADTIVVGS